jgi:hypothetical protein
MHPCFSRRQRHPNMDQFGWRKFLHWWCRPTKISALINITQVPVSYTPLTDLPAGAKLYWRVRAEGTNPSTWTSSSFMIPVPPGKPTLSSPAGNALVSHKPLHSNGTRPSFQPVRQTWPTTSCSSIMMPITPRPSTIRPVFPTALSRFRMSCQPTKSSSGGYALSTC